MKGYRHIMQLNNNIYSTSMSVVTHSPVMTQDIPHHQPGEQTIYISRNCLLIYCKTGVNRFLVLSKFS